MPVRPAPVWESDVDPYGARRGTAVINWFHRNPAVSNQQCLYCGRFVGAGSPLESDREHLIARRFPPAGLMAAPEAFNLIFRACCDCNGEKAAIEERVSAVSLLTSPGREDPLVDADARRKAARSVDPSHNKPVGQVRQSLTLDFGAFSATYTAPAQLSRLDAERLAFRHIQGLFSLLTSKDPRRPVMMRLLPWRHFGMFGLWPYADWGNPQLLTIAERAYVLPRLAEFTTADGFFRTAMRRQAPAQPWFWALEWNQNFRVIGWIGERETPPPIFSDLPSPAWQEKAPGLRDFRQTRLPETAEDLLFDPVLDPPSGSGPPPGR